MSDLSLDEEIQREVTEMETEVTEFFNSLLEKARQIPVEEGS